MAFHRDFCLAILLVASNLISIGLLAQDSGSTIVRSTSQNTSRINETLDSLNYRANTMRLRDSLTICIWTDSLRSKVIQRFPQEALSKRSDSIQAILSPDSSLLHQSDSLLNQKLALLQEINEKQDSLQKSVSTRYARWMTSLRSQFNLDSAGIGLPRPPLSTVEVGTPIVGDLPREVGTIPEIPALNKEDFLSLGVSPKLLNIGGMDALPSPIQLEKWQRSLPTLPDPAAEVGKKMKELGEFNDPGKVTEKILSTQVKEVSDASAALQEFEETKRQQTELESIQNPNDLKEKAIDHFAGREAELKSTMGQMAKYKKKYSSLGSLSEIKKNDWLPRNSLKGKPFRERFRPGLNIGVRSMQDTVLIDLHPNAAYRISGRLEAGLGGIYRVRVTANSLNLDQTDPVWGLSTFIAFKTFKSVFLRAEADGTSHTKYKSNESASYRDWRWSFYTGVQTNFKLGKRWTGNVQMLYNFESNLKDGFPERLTVRLGFQYALKVK